MSRPTVLIALAAWAPEFSASEDAGKKQIEALLLRFAESLDQQNAGAAKQILHTESRQFAITPNGFMAIGLQEYLDRLEQKTIGGVASTPVARQIAITGAAASAILERPIESRGVLFTHYVQLLHADDAWTVVSVTIGITRTEGWPCPPGLFGTES